MAQVNWQQVNILVAEDEDDLRDILVSIFESEGSRVYSARDGNEAVEIINQYPVDIVVSDIRMPNCDGVKLLETIRARHPEIPLVFLATGFADINEVEAKQKGAAELIRKPYTIPDLMSAIETRLIQQPKFIRVV